MMSETELPFGVNSTKRYVSTGGERELFRKHSVATHGLVELVDYMGGDLIVGRVATAGLGRGVFPENPDLDDFINYLVNNGIYRPFKSVQFKFSIQAPIETALQFVYEPSVSVNEYSLRYSEAIPTSFVPSVDEMKKALGDANDERVAKALEIFRERREKVYAIYERLNELRLARELARIPLGIDNDTRFFWKIDIFSLAQFVDRMRRFYRNGGQALDYAEVVAEVAERVAPISWNALVNTKETNFRLTMPRDEDIVDVPLSHAGWLQQETRRVVVPELEEILFVERQLLDHGLFHVVDYMGDQLALAQAARVSYGGGTKALQDDLSLIRSLIRDLHTTPIEMAELAFESRMPLFIDPRQAGRHRTLDFHGFMGYFPLGRLVYFPPEGEFKYQDRLNRHGRSNLMDDDERKEAMKLMQEGIKECSNSSLALSALGAGNEMTRRNKGVGFYTKIWRTGDPHNLAHFLRLRLDKHAQKENRDLAALVDDAHKRHVPEANKAQHTYIIDALRLSTTEIKFLIDKGAFEGRIRDEDLEDPNFYKGYGFLVLKDRNDPSQGHKLGREGEELKEKIKRLMGKS